MQDDLEKTLSDLDKKIADLKSQKASSVEIQNAEKEKQDFLLSTTQNLSRWQRVLLARHALRPHGRDYIEAIFSDFLEIHGDRGFADDVSVVCGVASLENQSVMVIAQEKGRNTKEKLACRFGMPNPEGYRKALRCAHLADRFGLPLIALIDTPGANPGIEAEERGQAQSIAECIEGFFQLQIPIISIVIGEGGSGGALALGVADTVLMLEHSVYSVISPESCASILWSNAAEAPKAAEKLKMSAQDCFQWGIVDGVINEPAGGAHRNPQMAFAEVKKALIAHLAEIQKKQVDLSSLRIKKFRNLGSSFLSTGQ
jgi:acetyl-CoA carboxylase carboxyl transferase subunit alpha